MGQSVVTWARAQTKELHTRNKRFFLPIAEARWPRSGKTLRSTVTEGIGSGHLRDHRKLRSSLVRTAYPKDQVGARSPSPHPISAPPTRPPDSTSANAPSPPSAVRNWLQKEKPA